MRVRRFVHNNMIWIIALVAIPIVGIFLPSFFTFNNIMNITSQASITGIAAVGVTMAIITKGIDMSVSGLISCCPMVAGLLMVQGVSVPVAVITGIVIGMVAGFITGILVANIKVPPFVATYVMASVTSGIALLLNGGRSIAGYPSSYLSVGATRILGVPCATYIMIIMVCIGTVIMSKTVIGGRIYALGGNEEVVRTVGISEKKLLYFTYIFSGVCAAIAGLVLSSQLASTTPTQGSPYQLDSIAACVLGGTSMMGGEGKVIFSAVGAFLICAIRNALHLLGLDPFYQDLIVGVLIVVIVAINMNAKRLSARKNAVL